MSRRDRLRRLAGNLALALVSVALGLGLAEILLRRLPETRLGFRYEDGVFGMPREYERDPRRNADGFHDLDHGPKASGARRVLLLGDSYVEGYSVPLEATLGRVLERELNHRAPPAWEVVSVARSGWSQLHPLRALRRFGGRREPDLVLTVFLSFNDVAGNSPPLRRRIARQIRESEGYFRGRPGWSRYRAEDMPLFWLERSRLNQLLSYRLAVALRDRSPDAVPLDYLVYSRTPGPEWERAWRATEAVLRDTRDAAVSLGARYAVVAASTPHGILGALEGLERLRAVYPALADVDLDLDGPDRRLGRVCRDEGIPFLALEPALRVEQRSGPDLHWPYDGHWNAIGNERAARLIGGFVRDLERGRDPAAELPPAPDQAIR